MTARLTLVLGGARSGKSAMAERLVTGLPGPWTYIATAQAFDEEMRQRIRQHQADRVPGWQTLEEPMDLAGALASSAAAGPVLVDCLTLWLTNLMLAGRDIPAERARLLALLPTLPAPVVLVGNEVGLGIVPENKLARQFRDHAGRLHQDIARIADRVLFMAAGLPLALKGEAP
ncbi:MULTISPECIES: bifunctional adenosylcobinamide kinase/adenosylcobinamide-phosphate guanylyltransferase [unclassified Azospirillum]|uniref:bifunctional adenosylcobinamide kinase/adenosylcobinamide-phosphate guanylyltransferase n=1 Tax=unclassified Azospirillum TaxID=2630922 RepID=UPI000B7562B0|nr:MULTISPECIES: bifunctional adenosylcobinamide kinase/adenosylcobinamide-phosphate guanylyltransferase [unclassified Azospirillum]SNS79711.1 adenosylcobinamide kinase /adenosylcobinamide-phosphate guanylyltransferase [Azospirillum sp. RU38E]SNS96969.1 adenosylcobinamide kinase /adenosylcobinamide-phosphate guanylyltransferase [Azospirillum sp. RU37A]